MEVKQNLLFKCDGCGKVAEGGHWYLKLPQGWHYAYFNNLGGSDNQKHDYCDILCFEKRLDEVLREEKKSRMGSFIHNE